MSPRKDLLLQPIDNRFFQQWQYSSTRRRIRKTLYTKLFGIFNNVYKLTKYFEALKKEGERWSSYMTNISLTVKKTTYFSQTEFQIFELAFFCSILSAERSDIQNTVLVSYFALFFRWACGFISIFCV